MRFESSLFDDAAAVLAEAVELAVTVLEREGYGAFCGGAAAADFGNIELDAAGSVNANPMILTGGRALDRAALGLEYAGNGGRRLAGVDIDLETDGFV